VGLLANGRNVLFLPTAWAVVLGAVTVSGQTTQPTIGAYLESQVEGAGVRLLEVAQAMPERSYDFRPTNGTFDDVRTFAEQLKHVAAANRAFAAAILGRPRPVSRAELTNGPAMLLSKTDIISYLQSSISECRVAVASLDSTNYHDRVINPFLQVPMSKLSIAAISFSHSYDHYGQLVVYLRMNGVVPPATQSSSQAPKPIDIPKPKVEIFAAGIISLPGEDRSITFEPGMRTSYFVRRTPATISAAVSVVLETHLRNGTWSSPEVAKFSGRYFDADPFVSPDGKTMFFISTRPTSNSGKDKTHIWMMHKTADRWSEPENLTILNSPGNDAFPTAAANGNLYFWSDRSESGPARLALYRSEFREDGYQPPEKLPPPLNSEKWPALQPYVAPDEGYIIFVSAGRSDEQIAVGSPAYVRGDLYVSFRSKEGLWTTPLHLPEPINSSFAELTPTVSPDGKWLFFMSERCFVPSGHEHRFTYHELVSGHSSVNDCNGNIFRTPTSVIEDLRSQAVFP